MYWVDASGDNPEPTSVGRANVDGSGVNDRFISTAHGNLMLAVDGQHVYWADWLHGTIGRANLDGSDAEPEWITVPDAFLAPTGLAVDGAHIYWAGHGVIGRANLEGSDVEPNWIANAHQPLDIAVDGGHVYWSDSGSIVSGSIARANIDGSGVDLNFIQALGPVDGIAVDSQHIYWQTNQSGKLGRANLDGSGANGSFVNGDWSTGDVAVDGSYLYWANGSRVERASLGDPTAIDPSFIIGSGVAVGVAVDAGNSAKPRLTLLPREQAAQAGHGVHAFGLLGGSTGSPTGTLTLSLFGPNDPTCSKAPAFTGTAVVRSATSSLTGDFVPTKVGSYEWVGSYSGDAHNDLSTTACGNAGDALAVEKAVTALTPQASPSVTLGAPISAGVQLDGGANPTGQLTFELHPPDDATCSAPSFVSFASLAVSGNGHYDSPALTPTVAGDYHWRVRYSGDANNLPFLSDCAAAGAAVTVAPPASDEGGDAGGGGNPGGGEPETGRKSDAESTPGTGPGTGPGMPGTGGGMPGDGTPQHRGPHALQCMKRAVTVKLVIHGAHKIVSARASVPGARVNARVRRATVTVRGTLRGTVRASYRVTLSLTVRTRKHGKLVRVHRTVRRVYRPCGA